MWSKIDTLICHIPGSFKFNKIVAIFSFYDCLIRKKAHQRHHSEIVKKLNLLLNNGVSVIVVESLNLNTKIPQLRNVKAFCDLFETFKKETQLPIACIASTQHNKYAKPYTNIWCFIKRVFQLKGKITIDPTKSMIIGTNAGRKYNVHLRDDKSCIDRSFAHNINVKFTTPNVFFQNDILPVHWSWMFKPNSEDLAKLIKQKPKNKSVMDELDELDGDKKIVIITGLKSCGKTTFANQIKNLWGVSHIHDDIPEIIDNVLIDVAKSKKLMEIIKNSMTFQIPTLIVELKIPRELRILFRNIQLQTSKNTAELFSFDDSDKIDLDVFKDVKYIRYVKITPNIKPSDEFWYKYG